MDMPEVVHLNDPGYDPAYQLPRMTGYIKSDLIRSLLSQIEGGRDKHGHPLDNNVVVMKVRELVG